MLVCAVPDVHLGLEVVPAFHAGLPLASVTFGEMMRAERVALVAAVAAAHGGPLPPVRPGDAAHEPLAAVGRDQDTSPATELAFPARRSRGRGSAPHQSKRRSGHATQIIRARPRRAPGAPASSAAALDASPLSQLSSGSFVTLRIAVPSGISLSC